MLLSACGRENSVYACLCVYMLCLCDDYYFLFPMFYFNLAMDLDSVGNSDADSPGPNYPSMPTPPSSAQHNYYDFGEKIGRLVYMI